MIFKVEKFLLCSYLTAVLLVVSLLTTITLQSGVIKYEETSIPYASAQTMTTTTNQQQQQQTVTNNSSTNTTIEFPVNTFMAQGSINELIPFYIPSSSEGDDVQSQDQLLFLLGGDWVLSVNDGVVDDFSVNIEMVAEDGTLWHFHTIQNLSNVSMQASPLGTNQADTNQSNNNNNISISQGANGTLVFSGFADITTNGVTEWENVALTISIANGNLISIIPNPAEVDHFYALPIYGIVRSLIDKSGQSLRDVQITDNNATAIPFHGRGSIAFNYENGGGEGDSLGGGGGTTTTGNQTGISQTGTGSSSFLPLSSTRTFKPIVEKMTEDGRYLVQLRWSPSIGVPLPRLDYQIFFLDPKQPRATEDIVPSWESNYSAFSQLSPAEFIDPDIVLNFEQVDTYDMTVYTETGNIIWQRDDLAVYGGRDSGLIFFENEYRGPIIVEITDIQPALDSFSTRDREAMPSSVTFRSLIVEGG